MPGRCGCVPEWQQQRHLARSPGSDLAPGLRLPAPTAPVYFPACTALPRLPACLYRSRDQQYAASRKLLALAGVKLRQHIFRRPIVLRLTNDDAKRQAAAAALSGTCGGSDGSGSGEVEVEEAAVAPALAAVLKNGITAAATGAGATATQSRRRRRGRQPPQQAQQAPTQ